MKNVRAIIDLDIHIDKDVTTKIKAGAIIPEELVDRVPEVFKKVESTQKENPRIDWDNSEEEGEPEENPRIDREDSEEEGEPEKIVNDMSSDEVLSSAKKYGIEVVMQQNNPDKPTKKGLADAREALISTLEALEANRD